MMKKNSAPFVGRAGRLLTKIIQAMGFKRSDVYSKCRRKTTTQKYKEGLIKIKFCLSSCPHLSPTEKEQSHLKEPHFCSLYNQRLYHLGYHPNIVSCAECPRKK